MHNEDIIKYEVESSTYDFKLEEYKLGKHTKKTDILVDISAMANHPSDGEKYILIGIKKKNGEIIKIQFIENVTDDAIYQQYVNEH